MFGGCSDDVVCTTQGQWVLHHQGFSTSAAVRVSGILHHLCKATLGIAAPVLSVAARSISISVHILA